jgi:hypothetical protein
VVATAVIEVQVGVDDQVDAGEVEVLLAQWPEAGIHVGHRRVQLLDAGIDQHAPIGMVDDVHIDRHPLALGEQIGNADRRNGGWHRANRAQPAAFFTSSTMRASAAGVRLITAKATGHRSPSSILADVSKPSVE